MKYTESSNRLSTVGFLRSAWILARKSMPACGLLLATGFAVVLSGCSDASPVSLRDDSERIFWAIENDIKAATIAIGETQKITAIPLNINGEELTGVGTPRYRSLDHNLATVDSLTGVITGIAATSSVSIVAYMTIDGVTLEDVTQVAVTSTRRPIKTFSIQPLPSDSTKFGMNSTKAINLAITDSSNLSLRGTVAVFASTSDRSVGYMQSATNLRGYSRGSVTVYASTTSYGVTWRDSLTYTITFPKTATVQMTNSASPVAHMIGTAGRITWTNLSTFTGATIEFDKPSEVEGGDIQTIMFGMSQSRAFQNAGTFKWKNSAGVESGSITVLQE